MRVDNDPSPIGTADTAAAAAAAAAAQDAARVAAQRITDPDHRAAAGFGLAARSPDAGAGPSARAVADAPASVATALARSDVPPAQAAQTRTVLQHLGNALVDGRIDPHINDTFRSHLYDLATAAPDSAAYRGALAQLTRAAQVLDQVELAQGSRLTYDPRAGQPEVARAGLPVLNVADIDADLYFRTSNGVVHIEGAKATPQALSNEVQRSSTLSQLQRQMQWEQAGTPAEPRAVNFFTQETQPGFNNLLDDRRMAQLQAVVGGDADARRFVIGDRAYSINDLRAIAAQADAAAPIHVEGLRQQHIASGQPEASFNTGDAYRSFYRETLATPETAARHFGGNVGQPVAELRPQALAAADLPSARQGGVWGAAGGAAISLVQVGLDGQITGAEALQVGQATLLGGGVGALTAAGERVVSPVVDRAIGPTVQRAATAVAPRVLSSAAPEATAAFGAGARTLASRVGGATVVGAVVATGISAYENREGLARGDSQAIGNVAADTTVAVGSIAAATAAGAAIGSVVPVAGTAVGAVVGLAVGVGVAYGAQISGARDAVANTVSGWVDGVKGWFN
jgi:hypothetical protein